MYTLYLDETGDWGYPNYNPKYPILCICGSIIHYKYYANEFAPSFTSLKKAKFKKDLVLHRYKVQLRTHDFSILKTQDILDACMLQISQFIARLDFKILIAALDKEDHYRTYGVKKVDAWLPKDIYSMLFTFVLERFVAFLRQNGGIKGKVVAESRGRKEDQRVQYWYSTILQNGTQFYRDWQFQEVLPTAVEFKPKGDNILGLQISDWVARPMSKMIEFPDGREDKYGEWELYKDKIWIGKDAPGRGQVGFKVFPKNIGRRLLNMPLKSAKDSK